MFEFASNQLLFWVVLAFLLFLPGYSLLLAVFGKKKVLEPLEGLVVSFGLSIVSVDFLAFGFSRLGVPFNRLSVILEIGGFSLICLAIYKIFHKKDDEQSADSDKLFSFSKNQFILILLLLSLVFIIKTAYLSQTVAPTATDMGHHMYWAKHMAETGTLPDYEGMPDFIIGEHIIFGMIAIPANLSFFSAFPVLVLYLINILSILTVFILVLRVFKNKTVAILSLFFLGVLFAVSSPQAKFVSGGVIGNIMGNFLMPLTFFLYYRGLEFLEQEKIDGSDISRSKIFLSLAIFANFGLFYTHHLTSFIFLFTLPLILILYALANIKDIETVFKNIINLAKSPWILGTFALGLFFFFYVFVPNYVDTSAVSTAVGAPSKATRDGLSIANLESTIGEARLALGFLGLLLLALSYKRKNFGYAIISSWAVMVFLMSNKPQLLLIDLPSSRIGNYLSYPMAILSAYAFYAIFKPEGLVFLKKTKGLVPFGFLQGSFAVIFAFVAIGGLKDSAQAFKDRPDFAPLIEIYKASEYTAKHSGKSDMLLKDHNYLTGDSWIKLFFMRGYRYPLSRSYFKRYEDPTKPREMCTLWMISSPRTDEAQKCFDETGTNFIMVSPQYDSAQFQRGKEFDQIYIANNVAVYYRK